MVGLKKQLKENNIQNIYLFYGEENYLKQVYVDRIKKQVVTDDGALMNLEIIEKDFNENQMINSFETLPFLAEKRLVIIKGSQFFVAKSPATDQFISVLNNFPPQTVVIFVEDKVDKRNKVYKAIKKNGYVVEFNLLGEQDLVKWIAIELKGRKKKADTATIISLIRTVGTNMDNLSMEIDKLCSYALDREIITKADVEAIATKSIEYKIFELVDAMGMKKGKEAIVAFNNLLVMNEPPIRILIMLTRQFRLIYQIKVLLADGFNVNSAAKKLGLPLFVAKKCDAQGRYYSAKMLEEALEECLFIDTAIKSGQIKDKLAVEMLLTKYSTKHKEN